MRKSERQLITLGLVVLFAAIAWVAYGGHISFHNGGGGFIDISSHLSNNTTENTTYQLAVSDLAASVNQSTGHVQVSFSLTNEEHFDISSVQVLYALNVADPQNATYTAVNATETNGTYKAKIPASFGDVVYYKVKVTYDGGKVFESEVKSITVKDTAAPTLSSVSIDYNSTAKTFSVSFNATDNDQIATYYVYWADLGTNSTVSNTTTFTTVTVQPVNESSMSVLITSERPFSATFWPVVQVRVVNRTVIMNQTNETKIRELQALVEELNATLQEKEVLIANLTAELNTLRSENSKLNATSNTLLKTVSSLRGQLHNKSAAIRALEAEREALLNQTFELKGKVAALIAGWNATNSTLREKEALISQLNASLAREKNLTANLTVQIQKLKGEKAQLEKQVSELKGQIRDYPALKARLVNLTRENRELKAELANLTQRYNSLKGENDFLREQNAEYKGLINSLVEKQSQQSTDQYLEKAKKERTIGSILWKSLIAALVVAGVIGYLLYKKKRSWEYPL